MKDDHMCGEFDESCVFSFADGVELEIIQRAVELAVQDYDRVVFGLTMLNNGEAIKQNIEKFLPELKTIKN
jgi:hypothetical protein